MTQPTQAQIEAAAKMLENVPITRTEIIAALNAAAQVGEPLYKMKGELDPETHRLWRAINGYDIDDHDKRAEAFVHSMLDGLTVGPGNRATVKSSLAENFEQLAKDRVAATIERCAQVIVDMLNAKPDGTNMINGVSALAAIRKLKDEP